MVMMMMDRESNVKKDQQQHQQQQHWTTTTTRLYPAPVPLVSAQGNHVCSVGIKQDDDETVYVICMRDHSSSNKITTVLFFLF
jgi:hypothetical protein